MLAIFLWNRCKFNARVRSNIGSWPLKVKWKTVCGFFGEIILVERKVYDKQAMVTLQGMTEHWFSNVYN